MFLKNYVGDAKRQAATDAAAGVYDPDRCMDFLAIPAPDDDDPVEIELNRSKARTLHVEATATYQQKCTERVQAPPRLSRLLGITGLFAGEGGALVVFFSKELGFSPGGAVCFAGLLTPGSFYLTHLVRKHVFGEDRRWWAYLLLVVYIVFAFTLTFLRTVAHGAPDTGMAYNIGIGIVLCLATLLPGWLADALYYDVRATTPVVRALHELRLQVDEHEVDLETTTAQRRAIRDHDALLRQVRAAYNANHDAACAALGKPQSPRARAHLLCCAQPPQSVRTGARLSSRPRRALPRSIHDCERKSRGRTPWLALARPPGPRDRLSCGSSRKHVRRRSTDDPRRDRCPPRASLPRHYYGKTRDKGRCLVTPDEQPLVEQQADTYLAITEPNGATKRLLQRRETVELNPATGERTFRTDEVLYTSTEGKTVDLKTYTICARCNAQPLSNPTPCNDCKKYLCAPCTHHQRCHPCHLKYRVKGFLRWITSL